MKKLLLLLLTSCLFLSFAACGDSNGDGTPDLEGLDASEWTAMLADTVFENYTLTMEGRMTVTQGNETREPYDMKQVIKTTADQISITLYHENQPVDTMVFDGEIAKTQKNQNSQLFLTILRQYDSFVFDADTKTYKILETVSFDTVLKGLSFDDNDTPTEFDVPATIVIREATATLSEDNHILTFVCDYSQTMDIEDTVTTTAGLTTWTFTDYGSTVIEPAP